MMPSGMFLRAHLSNTMSISLLEIVRGIFGSLGGVF